ncbi:rCG46649 [Rattus norvegicus]|uniref:RCG46649 n=1 Tax=Rattus norvegicus TaxID=10116 RepID=A6IXA5_RAT|nr:rCG46649 [Rattus norvegicus]
MSISYHGRNDCRLQQHPCNFHKLL